MIFKCVTLVKYTHTFFSLFSQEEIKKRIIVEKKEKPVFHAMPFSIETSLILLLILSGILFNPVSAKVYANYTPQFFVGNESPMKESTPVNITYGVYDISTYTPEERKLATRLRTLLFPEKDPIVTPAMINSTLLTLIGSNLYKFPGELLYEDKKNGTTVIAKTDMIYVNIAVTSGISTHILDSYLYPPIGRNEDIFGLYSNWNGNNVDAWVELSQVMNIANISSVRRISPVILGTFTKGSITTEGDGIHHSDLARNLVNNTNLSEIKIGVISDGVTNKQQAISSGDLPASLKVIGTGEGDEGTAMLEIIHDIVPNASLYFHPTLTTQYSFSIALSDLINEGCTIICDDACILFEPAFYDGNVTTLMNNYAQNQNVLFISSAANYAKSHYQGFFFPQNSDPLLNDFSKGGLSPEPVPDKPNLYARLNPGDIINVALHWDDGGQSGNDYDLYLLNFDTDEILASSIDYQTGSEIPFEFISYNSSDYLTAMIQVKKKFPTVQNKTLELFIDVDDAQKIYTNNIVEIDSIFEHAAASGVVTVGAAPYDNTHNIEPTSSQGCVTIQYPVPEIRNKPDITGVDKVSVTGAGGFNSPFYGTSASAPHIAGIAGLLWSKNTSKTASEIKNAILTTADARGDHYLFGSGLANASRAYYYLYPGPTVTSITPNIGVNDELVLSTNLTGTNFESDASVYLSKTGQSQINAINISVISSALLT